MEIEYGKSDSIKTPPRRSTKFLEFAKMKARKKFISTLFRTINRYRAHKFQELQKLSKFQAFLKILSKYLNPPLKQKIFWLLKQRDSELAQLLSNLTLSINTLSSIFSNFKLRNLSASFHRVLYYKKKPSFTEPATDINQILAFYYGQVSKTLLRFERKMKSREEIWKDRAYMKILAYSKWLKFLSPYPSRNSSPSKSPSLSPNISPFKAEKNLSPYSPDRYKLIPKFNRSNPNYFRLFKMFTFIDQNKFMAQVKSFKIWKFHYLVDSLSM